MVVRAVTCLKEVTGLRWGGHDLSLPEKMLNVGPLNRARYSGDERSPALKWCGKPI